MTTARPAYGSRGGPSRSVPYPARAHGRSRSPRWWPAYPIPDTDGMSGTTAAPRTARAHLAFTLALHHALPDAPTDAVCWSPYSVASALGLAATGARGATRDEMAALLFDGASDDDLAALLAEASHLTSNRRGDPPVLGVSNTLWAREDLPIVPEFAERLLSWPNGALRDAPFRSDLDSARRMINADVADATHDLIRDLLAPGALGRDTVALLVNALYLKTAWLNDFSVRATASEPFHGPDGTARVPTMHLEKRLAHAARDGWQAVTLPADGDVEAVILLPDGDLPPAEAALDADTLAGLLDASTANRTVRLWLPRFQVRAKAPLTSALRSLGVATLFGPQADLGGISSEPLSVSSVLHEAVLTVDEHGLEGAAATAMAIRAMAMHRDLSEPLEVRVDRPFLFLVRHRPTGAVYFLARVVRP